MSTSRRIKVAAAQYEPKLGDMNANLDRHLAVVDAARSQDVELLVFPELSLTGYDVGSQGHRLGVSLDDPLENSILGPLLHAAGPMRIVVGFIEEGYGAQFFNAAAVIHGGALEFVHRKLNLANYGDMQEAKFFAQGRYIEPFELPGRFVGSVLLCSDMWNPPLVHIAALHGATLLIVPTNSSLDDTSGDVSKPERWDLVLRFYASLYGLPIVFANRVGSEGPHKFWGGSRILDPTGNIISQAEGDAEQLVVGELSYDDVREARYRLPTVRDSNLALIQREIDRLAARIGVPTLVRGS